MANPPDSISPGSKIKKSGIWALRLKFILKDSNHANKKPFTKIGN
jgi:hypothetical protein